MQIINEQNTAHPHLLSSAKNILIIDNRLPPEHDQIVTFVQKQCPDAKITYLVKKTAGLQNNEKEQVQPYVRKSPISICSGIIVTLRIRKIKPDVILIRKHDITIKFLFLILMCMPIKVYVWRIHANAEVSISKINWRSLLIRPYNKPDFLISLICSFLPILLLITFLPILWLKNCSGTKKKKLWETLKSNQQQGPLGDSPWLWAWLQLVMLWVFVLGKSADAEHPSRILVIRNDHIGDAINTIPLVRHLRKEYPKAKITILCDAGFFVWENCPYVDEVLLYKTNNPLFNRVKKRASYVLRPFTFLTELRKRKFDLVFDPVGRTETHILSYLCGGSRRFGSTYYPYELFDVATSCRHYESELHETQRALSLAKPINEISDKECELEIWLKPQIQDQAKSYLAEKGIDREDKILGVHPGAVSPLRLWPIERFATVADKLAHEYDMKIVFFEPPDNVKMTKEFTSSLSPHGPKSIIVRGLDLPLLTAIISKCNLFLCNDSGPMHLAAATKTPMIAIFGPGEYYRWQPLHHDSAIVRKPFSCSPCSQNKCPIPQCTLQIEISDVLQAAEKLLSRIQDRQAKK